MIKTVKLLTCAFLSAAALMGCTMNPAADGKMTTRGNTVTQQVTPVPKGPHKAHSMNDSSLIPSENGQKNYTTNNLGQTTYGLGTSVYSMIGSSGLHANGFSAHLESRLSSAGIPDVRVFVFDDTVVLATAKREASASSYDELQRKLLNQNEGMSSNGTAPGEGLGGVQGTERQYDNLSNAASHIKELMGAEVKVLVAEGEKAVQTIEKIRSDALADQISPDQIAQDIRVLLSLTTRAGQ
ncbi:hypothetical protein [Paenibacillus paeoniae]|uniref:Sporulation protein n=1 Tax=Paenibacillus paeoniae TaxID=2292705 RepID=A0A371P6J0_9BACL|nr:hypothetical protein [Paenibacillus paeoniae]REK71148.1 hypothetical protein DX130_22095 [Paenibacillus paeoniae]